MYSIILTILSCLIIILLFNKLFNNKFESFNLLTDLNKEITSFDEGEDDGGGSGSLSGTNVIVAPNTGEDADTIDTSSRIIIQRMCKSTDCTDRETRWGSPNKGDWSVKPETFKQIIDKLNLIN
jgi:hypothetical protein